MNVTDFMLSNGIRSIVYVPACDLVPQDAYHVWLFSNHLECGSGASVEEALADAATRQRREAA